MNIEEPWLDHSQLSIERIEPPEYIQTILKDIIKQNSEILRLNALIAEGFKAPVFKVEETGK